MQTWSNVFPPLPTLLTFSSFLISNQDISYQNPSTSPPPMPSSQTSLPPPPPPTPPPLTTTGCLVAQPPLP
ncbi:hypothetical protein Hdeb2414_s0067g00768721 [Helianthus debilis subsp. tardiflorus]